MRSYQNIHLSIRGAVRKYIRIFPEDIKDKLIETLSLDPIFEFRLRVTQSLSTNEEHP